MKKILLFMLLFGATMSLHAATAMANPGSWRRYVRQGNLGLTSFSDNSSISGSAAPRYRAGGAPTYVNPPGHGSIDSGPTSGFAASAARPAPMPPIPAYTPETSKFSFTQTLQGAKNSIVRGKNNVVNWWGKDRNTYLHATNAKKVARATSPGMMVSTAALISSIAALVALIKMKKKYKQKIRDAEIKREDDPRVENRLSLLKKAYDAQINKLRKHHLLLSQAQKAAIAALVVSALWTGGSFVRDYLINGDLLHNDSLPADHPRQGLDKRVVNNPFRIGSSKRIARPSRGRRYF